MDHIAHISGAGTSGAGGDELQKHLLSLHSAVTMLNDRIALLPAYLAAVASKEKPFDHSAMRQISSLCSRLPVADPETEAGTGNKQADFNDALLIAYLAAVMKGSNGVNELLDKFAVEHERSSSSGGSRSRKGMGGGAMGRGMVGMGGGMGGIGGMGDYGGGGMGMGDGY